MESTWEADVFTGKRELALQKEWGGNPTHPPPCKVALSWALKTLAIISYGLRIMD